MHKKIKVVFIMNNFTVGGAERLLFDIIYFFDKDKYDVKIITVLGSGPLEPSFRKLGIPIYFAGFSSSLYQKLHPKLYWSVIAPIIIMRIIFCFLKNKPDVVFSTLFQADFLGIISAKIAGVKKRILVQVETIRFEKLTYIMKKNFALNFSTQIISGSETIKDFLVEYFEVKEEKITTIYNGINYERFRKGMKLVSDFNNPVIGIVARLDEGKGHIYALEALKILKKPHNLSIVTLIAGDGVLRNDLEKYTIENNLSNVKFLGNVFDVPDFLTQVDILVFPSIEEGFGLVTIEGMVSGKVVIASDIKVMKELIKDGETGLLFKSQDPSSLVSILLKVLGNKEICKKLQKNALSFTEKNKKLFDICEVSNNYQKLLESK